MRVLFVTPRLPYLPCHDAARLAASHLVDHLAGRHAVAVVAATGSGDTPAQRGWLASRAALVETVPACHESATLRARDVRRAGDSAGRRLAARVDERAETAWAREWFGAATACVVDSEDDRRALVEHVPFERIDVLPAGIDDVKYAYRRSGEPWRLVFTGDLSAPRDVDAARRLAGAILPRVRRAVPRAELLLAGADGAADAVRALGALPGVRVTASLADLRARVWGAAVY